jgi:membrane associated rhomboid family serine protease
MMQAEAPRRPVREPVFNLPGAVLVVLVVLAAVHLVRTLVLSDETDLELLLDFAAVPARWTVALDPSRAGEVLSAAGGNGAEESLPSVLARYVLAGDAHPWTALTYALLHGSWTHLLLNGVWFAAFATPVARRLGTLRLLALSLACAVAGALAHALMHPLSVLPMIGASAVVSGMMAAATRFIFAPPPAFSWVPTAPHARPRQSLTELAANPRAALFLGVWFLTNLGFGIFAAPLGVVDAGIAWEAHIGGFVAGLLLLPALDRVPAGRATDRPA